MRESQILRETELFNSYVWVLHVTFLCSIFLSALVRAIPCIGKDLGMCTVAYASLMVELQQDGYTSKMRESQILRETELFNSYVWVLHITLLCSIFLPVLVKAIPCIGKDLGMSTITYASLMVELQQDGYTSKRREFQLFEGNRVIRFVRLGVNHYLVVLYFPASACQSHPMYR